MRYKYAKTNRDGIDFTLVESYTYNDGIELGKFVEKHDPVNKNVIIVSKQTNGLNVFTGINHRKFDLFSTTENLENLRWTESYIDED